MSFRYHILAGVPPGGTYPFVNAAAYIAFGCALSSSRAYLFLSVARVLFSCTVLASRSMIAQVPLFFLKKTTHFGDIKVHVWKPYSKKSL